MKTLKILLVIYLILQSVALLQMWDLSNMMDGSWDDNQFNIKLHQVIWFNYPPTNK